MRQFDPNRERVKGEWVCEDANSYAERMQAGPLPQWPTEVLIEWFYRHETQLEKYAFFGYERFQFNRETWDLDQIPGREAFDDPSFCDGFMDVERRADDELNIPGQFHLAQYMLREGTWNTPVILLNNADGILKFPNGKLLRSPFHLLEGHRRLSFLNGLREIAKALPQHDVWIVSLD